MKRRSFNLLFITISLLTGTFSALISGNKMDIFNTLTRPPLSPPSVVFPVVWTLLYTLMGISAALIFNSNKNKWNFSLSIWVAQIAVNFLWSIIFFNFQAFLLAFVWLLLLWLLILIMIILFYRQNKLASLLQIPYLLWVTFAGYLTLSIYLLNN